MKPWVNDFKQFAIKGNAVDMAIGVVIGAAFGKIVSTLVSAIISPLIALLTGGLDFTNLKIVLRQAVMDGETVVRPEVCLGYGDLIQVIIDFLIVSLVIFWIMRIMTNLTKKKEEAPAPAPAPAPTPEDVLLLREIRDLLKDKESSK
jgi:large conductance mechanosensitive channel